MSDEKTPTWGYDEKTGEPKLFHVKDGKLPKGWVDSPAKAKKG